MTRRNQLALAAVAVALAAITLPGCPRRDPRPTPLPTPTPGPTATPRPTPEPSLPPLPMNPEAPRPVPYRHVVGPGECTGCQGFANCRGEGNCGGATALFQLACDRPNVALPPMPMPWRQAYSIGGSENIPVSFATAWYRSPRHREIRAWILEMERVQTSGDVPLFGRQDIFSPTYWPVTMGNWMVIRKRAEQLGDVEVRDAMDRLLRPAWAVLTLMAVQEATHTNRAWQHLEAAARSVDEDPEARGLPAAEWSAVLERSVGGDVFIEERIAKIGGPGLAAPCNRGYVNSRVGTGLPSFLGMALDHPGREWSFKLDFPGEHASRPICGPVMALNYKLRDGRVDLRSATPPASDFGLTARERELLKQYLLDDGRRHVSTILGWLGGYKLGCHLWILRTDRGVTAAFVQADGSATRACSGAKGGTWGAVTVEGGVATWLSRATRQNAPEAADIWRSGGKVYMEAPGSLPARDIPTATGAVVSEIVWEQDGTVRRVR